MTDIDNATTQELAAALAAREAAAAKERDDRERRLKADLAAWDRSFVDRFDQLEATLMAEQDTQRAAFTAAVRAADLPGAFAAWIAERAGRYARTSLRDTYRNAVAATGGDASTVADVRWYDPDLLRRLEAEADQQARLIGYDAADQLAGERPTQ